MAKDKTNPAEAAEPKKIKFAEKTFADGTLTIAFGNGTTLSLSIDEVPEDLHTDLIGHGMAQKIGDSYAGAKGDYDAAIKSAQQVIDQLKNGDWRAARGSGESKPRVGELAAAVARVKAITVDEALKIIDNLGEEDKKAVRNHPAVKLAIAQIRAEKAQAAADKAAPLAL